MEGEARVAQIWRMAHRTDSPFLLRDPQLEWQLVAALVATGKLAAVPRLADLAIDNRIGSPQQPLAPR